MLERMFDPGLLDPSERIRKLSRHEFEQLVALGAFEDERVELLRGTLVTMSPQGGPHAAVASWLAQVLIRSLDETYDVRTHSAFAASDDSEPEPDVSVARRAPGHVEHPSAALLLVEVAQSSLRKDRMLKAPIYCDARVPEYWIVDISGDELCVHVYTQPTRDGYARVEVARAGDVLRPIALAGVEIAVVAIPWR